MHMVTVDFIANTDDEAEVRDAYGPIMDKYASEAACLGCALIKSKSRREPRRYTFLNMWTSREEAMAISSREDVVKAHDIIEKVNSGESKLSAWAPVSVRGLLAK